MLKYLLILAVVLAVVVADRDGNNKVPNLERVYEQRLSDWLDYVKDGIQTWFNERDTYELTPYWLGMGPKGKATEVTSPIPSQVLLERSENLERLVNYIVTGVWPPEVTGVSAGVKKSAKKDGENENEAGEVHVTGVTGPDSDDVTGVTGVDSDDVTGVTGVDADDVTQAKKKTVATKKTVGKSQGKKDGDNENEAGEVHVTGVTGPDSDDVTGVTGVDSDDVTGVTGVDVDDVTQAKKGYEESHPVPQPPAGLRAYVVTATGRCVYDSIDAVEGQCPDVNYNTDPEIALAIESKKEGFASRPSGDDFSYYLARTFYSDNRPHYHFTVVLVQKETA